MRNDQERRNYGNNNGQRRITRFQTKVFPHQYEGRDLFAVFKVDETGNKLEERPLLSMGFRKAKAIQDHIHELNNFVEVNTRS